MLLELLSSLFPLVKRSFTYSSTKEDDPNQLDLKKAISQASSESDISLRNFINVLQTSIIDVSKLYRENIQKQITVLTQNDESLLNGQEFIELKEEYIKLKDHLRDYKLLAVNSGNMAYNQAIASLHSGSSNPGYIVCKVYKKFEKSYLDEYKLNEDYERRLNLTNAKFENEDY